MAHTVTVTEDGFENAGTSYLSLTKIAKKDHRSALVGSALLWAISGRCGAPGNGGRDG
jgi:hypothetical protein